MARNELLHVLNLQTTKNRLSNPEIQRYYDRLVAMVQNSSEVLNEVNLLPQRESPNHTPAAVPTQVNVVPDDGILATPTNGVNTVESPSVTYAATIQQTFSVLQGMPTRNPRKKGKVEVQSDTSRHLPCLIFLQYKHPVSGDLIQALGVLWYIDAFSVGYTQRPGTPCQYKYGTDADGKENPSLLPARVCFFHTIVQVNPSYHPLQEIVGKCFSSLEFSASLLGCDNNWFVVVDNTRVKFSDWVKGNDATQTPIFHQTCFKQPYNFPNTRTPSITARNLFASLCIRM